MRQGAGCLLSALAFVTLIGPAPSRGDEVSLPDERLGVRTVPLLLLSRPDVRADLGLDQAQTDAAHRAIDDLHRRASAVRGMPNDKAIAARRAIDEAEQLWITTHLSPKQAARLVQIDLQWEGPAALINRPVVGRTLALSSEQGASLTRAVDAHKARRRIRGTLDLSEEKRLAEQVLATLSAEQKSLWRSMLGDPFVPQLASSKPVPRR